ncbi:hypothetical protein WBG99_28415 [Streptomyces sp. TG1A-60]|uniref:hypothetical protein n=1 Tax=Streptomyces sp. TG1A-60 TaxID=3129111 RepID=UPI0030CC592F
MRRLRGACESKNKQPAVFGDTKNEIVRVYQAMAEDSPSHTPIPHPVSRKGGPPPAGHGKQLPCPPAHITYDADSAVRGRARRERRERHWAESDAFLQLRVTEPLATGTLGFVETVRTLDLMGHLPEATEDLDARITEILLTREVRDGAALLGGRLRALDAIRVASAVSLRDDLTAPVTYDRRMPDTARAEGLSAHAPGMAE